MSSLTNTLLDLISSYLFGKSASAYAKIIKLTGFRVISHFLPWSNRFPPFWWLSNCWPCQWRRLPSNQGEALGVRYEEGDILPCWEQNNQYWRNGVFYLLDGIRAIRTLYIHIIIKHLHIDEWFETALARYLNTDSRHCALLTDGITDCRNRARNVLDLSELPMCHIQNA